ncbi:hypothetical protein BV25DRAFT_1895420 [Artomyces pyxidatus]|uniref:Uncharacterized protein n=1 Tax=Artomyces pyxidatus TaxID=48021 RepID=A0ACB8SGY5_9AGAM|nr:hypothetical protein BV25DRAFT_1895420 [Artomyces pyxidatus]
MSTPIQQSLADTSNSRNKRQHREDEEEQINVVHSPDLWLKDGNILIRTTSKDTPPTQILYKVHKHTLALHSSVFATLFDGPQEALEVGSEHLDGIPVMDLPDEADDVRDFLKALYFPKQMQIHSPATSPYRDGLWNVFPASYHGILRLAVKYDAPDIRDFLVSLLKSDWPVSQKEWQSLRDRNLAGREKAPTSSTPVVRELGSIAKVVNLARVSNVSDILPVVFYELSCASESIQDHQHASMTAGISVLSARDLTRLVVGKADLRGKLPIFIDLLISASTQSGCSTSSHTCEERLNALAKSRCSAVFQHPDPIWWFYECAGTCDDIPKNEICRSCAARMKKSSLKVHMALWHLLPHFFELDGVVST